MAKAEWGTKRICHSCAARFYDLQRDPIVCPKCKTEYDPEAVLKSRRSRPVPEDKPAPKKKAPIVPIVAGDEADVVVADDAAVVDDAAEADDAIIEDTSDLGEDEDDVAEVIEKVEDEEER